MTPPAHRTLASGLRTQNKNRTLDDRRCPTDLQGPSPLWRIFCVHPLKPGQKAWRSPKLQGRLSCASSVLLSLLLGFFLRSERRLSKGPGRQPLTRSWGGFLNLPFLVGRNGDFGWRSSFPVLSPEIRTMICPRAIATCLAWGFSA